MLLRALTRAILFCSTPGTLSSSLPWMAPTFTPVMSLQPKLQVNNRRARLWQQQQGGTQQQRTRLVTSHSAQAMISRAREVLPMPVSLTCTFHCSAWWITLASALSLLLACPFGPKRPQRKYKVLACRPAHSGHQQILTLRPTPLVRNSTGMAPLMAGTQSTTATPR